MRYTLLQEKGRKRQASCKACNKLCVISLGWINNKVKNGNFFIVCDDKIAYYTERFLHHRWEDCNILRLIRVMHETL